MIVLDTHVWIWWIADFGKLSKRARRAIADADRIGVAAISCWELCMLVEKGRISLDRGPVEWMEQALDESNCELLPLTPAVAFQSTRFGSGFQGDPADRLIAATSVVHGASLATKDMRLRKLSAVPTVW